LYICRAGGNRSVALVKGLVIVVNLNPLNPKLGDGFVES
jgi:hypothetical protein